MTKVNALKVGIHPLEYIGLDVAKCSLGLVPDAVEKGLDNVFFEMITAGMGGNDLLALLFAKLSKADPENVHFHSGGHERDLGLFELGYPRCGMERDSVPDDVNRFARNLMPKEKLSRGVRAVYLKPFAGATVGSGQPDVMEHCADIEQFRIEAEFFAHSGQGTE
jgi:hypothetical protein